MIKFEYTIKRNENDEYKTYKPNLIPTELGNLVYIKGPNSSGKSTLLNFIALGFYGLKLPDSEIDPSLKQKLHDLLESNHQQVVFRISIDSPEQGIHLISEKSNFETNDISVKKIVNSKEYFLSYETFQNEYKLIYDIPNNPLERLIQLIKDVRVSQKEVGVRISSYRNYIKSLIDDIRESKDPQQLSTLHDKYNKLNEECQVVRNQVEVKKRFSIELYKFSLVKLFLQSLRERRELSQKLESLQESIEKTEKLEKKAIQAKLIVQKDIDTSINQCDLSYREAYSLLSEIVSKNDKPHFEYWVRSKISDEVYYPDKCKSLRAETQFFIQHLENLLVNEKIDRKKELSTIEVYKLLLSTLSDTRFNSIPLPGVHQTVENFKNDILIELEKLEHIERKFNNLKKCKEALENLNNNLVATISLINEKQKMPEYQDDKAYAVVFAARNELTSLKNQIQELDSKSEKYRTKLIDHHIDPHNVNELYETFLTNLDIKKYEYENENNLITTLRAMENQIVQDKEKLRKMEETLVIWKDEIIIMEAKETHEWRKYLSHLEVYYQKIQALEYKFKTLYMGYLDKISDPSQFGSLSNEQKIYATLLGNFLGSKIQSIRHIDQQYEVSQISIIEKVFITRNGKRIYFSDLGTGQSQSAFLSAKLSLNDNKKILALFDEVAMMDEASLLPVRTKIRDLYAEGKLIMSVIVQKNDSIVIEDI